MTRKKQTDMDTFVIGPSVCKGFSPSKDLCHLCVAKGMYVRAICFSRPTGSVHGIENERKQLQAVEEVFSGKKA